MVTLRLDALAANIKDKSKEEHASTVGIAEEEASTVRISDFLSAGLLKELLKLFDKRIYVGLTQTNNCAIVNDHIREERVRLFVNIGL